MATSNEDKFHEVPNRMTTPMLPAGEIRTRLQRLLPPIYFKAIILESSAPADIFRFAARVGLVYPGCRIESVPLPHVVEDIAKDAMDNPDFFAHLASWLTEKNLDFIQRTRDTSAEAVRDMHMIAEELLVTGRLGHVLWALLTDPRPAAESAIAHVIATAEKSLRKEDKEITKIEGFLDRLRRGQLKKNDMQTANDVIRTLMEKLSAKEKEAEHLLQESAALAAKHSSLSDQVPFLRRTLEEAQRDKAHAGKKLRDAEESLDRLRRELHDAQKAAIPFQEKISALEKEIHHQQRESRVVRYEVEKTLERSQAQEGRIQELQAEVNLRIREIEDLQKERAQLLKKMDSLAHQPVEGRPPIVGQSAEEKISQQRPAVAKRAGRVGVFLDARNLFWECRLRSTRLNFDEVLRCAIAGRNLIRAIAFLGVEEGASRHEGIARTLDHVGFETKAVLLLPHLKRPDGWDSYIAHEVAQAAQKYTLETAVLIGFGHEGRDLAKLLKEKQFQVECFCFQTPQNTSASNHDLCVDLTDASFHLTTG